MVKVDTQIEYPGSSSTDTYAIGIDMAEKAGYQILKKRNNAYLLVCETQVAGQRVSVNMAVPFPTPHILTINLQSDELDDQAALQAELARLVSLAPSAR